MFGAIKEWLAPPVFPGDEEKTRRASFLNEFICINLLFAGLITVAVLLGNNVPTRAQIIVTLWLVLLAMGWLIMRRGKITFIAFVLSILCFVFLTGANISLGTVRTPTTALYVIWILAVGILFQLRGVLIAISASSLAVLGLILAERAGLLPQPNYSVGVTQWMNYTALFCMTAGMVNYGNRVTRNALARAENELEQRKQAEAELRESESALNEAQSLAQIGSYLTNLKTGNLQPSPALRQIFGIDSSFVTSLENWGKLMAPGYAQKMLDYYQNVVEGDGKFDMEYEVIRPSDGQRRWVHALGRFVYDAAGKPTCLKGTIQDITERKLSEQRIEHMAYFDGLTGLANRRLLQDRLQHALLSSVRQKHFSVLLLVDLDNFKTLNDTLGHQRGDLLLQQVAGRLKECVRECDTVARIGSDEFIVLLAELGENALHAATHAAVVADKILHRLGDRYDIGDWAHSGTASIGITLFGEQTESVEAPMMRVDLAMHKAKDAGRNTRCFFDSQMQTDMVSALVLEEDLRHAILNQQFCVHYQAQVTGEKQIIGVEALLRWLHPVRGWVSPTEFVPMAEKTGLILPLGQWTLETACKQLVRWESQPRLAKLTLAVNVSARQFLQSDFVDQVLGTLKRTSANPRRLKLELTESLLIINVEDVIAKMAALGARGVGFTLDDFGTGYSSLSYLKRLPLDQLKIDQGFVRDILNDPDDAAIAKTVVALADSLGLSVIAEGVETVAQRDFLASLGCHSYQGYLFAPPLPVQEFEALVPV